MFSLDLIPEKIEEIIVSNPFLDVDGEIKTTEFKTIFSVKNENLKYFNENISNIQKLIKTENQKNSIQNWLIEFYKKFNSVVYWDVYTSDKNDIIFQVNISYAVLYNDNSGGMTYDYYIFVFGIDGNYHKHTSHQKLSDGFEMRNWWFKNVVKEIQPILDYENLTEEGDEFGGTDQEDESLKDMSDRMNKDISNGIFKKSYGYSEFYGYIKREFLILS